MNIRGLGRSVRTLSCLAVVALACIPLGAGAACAGGWSFAAPPGSRLEIGGRIFAGRQLELVEINKAGLFALSVDGHRAALIFVQAPGPGGGEAAHLVFRPDVDRVLHFAGVAVSEGRGPARLAATQVATARREASSSVLGEAARDQVAQIRPSR